MKSIKGKVKQLRPNISLEEQRDRFNRAPGNELNDNYDCDICHNKGLVAYIEDGEVKTDRCSCVSERITKRLVDRSGMSHLVKTKRLEDYKAEKDWQKAIKKKAFDYLKSKAKAFYIGGQIGSGKTHLCAGVTIRFMNAGNKTRYVQWRQLTSYLRMVMNTEEYYTEMLRLKTVPVLFIDDFLKTELGKQPTESDLKIAWELIDSRYQKPVRTIISSEHTVQSLTNVSEAVSSRIVEMTNQTYMIEIGKNMNKNYRMKGMI
jgi:DNA replication protein DnaC